jgi:hypothetical protein
MPSVTIRLPIEVHRQAKRLAAVQGCSIGQLVSIALEDYERDRQERAQRDEMIAGHWADVERAYADPAVAAEEQAEIQAWDDVSLADLHASIDDDW